MGQLRITLMYRWIVLCIFSLSLCHNAFSAIDQGKMKVTLEVTNKPRGQVLHMLEKQVGVIFFYASHLFNTEEKISISAVDKTLDEVLEKIFDGTGMVWSYDKDKIISVKPKKEAVIKESAGAIVDSNITSIDIRGKVVSVEGEPIPGATVLVKNSTSGGVSDADGVFSVTAKKKDVLIISSIGYETREITVTGNSVLAKLNLMLSKLDETVIVAYGTTTKRLNVGDVSTVKGKEIERSPISNPIQALQGRIPGLYITQQSGVSGGGYTVQLRGRNSINNGNEPLYIVDGVPYESSLVGTIGYGIIGRGSPLNYIDPSSIESIDVLKDADATSIYGSRGANGVILITTKKGKSGPLSFSLNVRSGLSKVSRYMDLMDGEEYLKMRHEAFKNDNLTPGPLDYDINGTWDTANYSDWQKKLIGGTAKFNDYQGTITGGNDVINFLVGLGYHNETTVFPGDFGNKKYSVRFNIGSSSKNKRLKLTFGGSYLADDNIQPSSDLTSYVYMPPLDFKTRNSDGSLNWYNSTWFNPYGAIEAKFNTHTNNLILNGGLDYNILKGLNFRINLGYSNQNVNEVGTSPLKSMPPIYYTEYGVKSSSYFNFTNGRTYNIEPQLEYRLNIGAGTFTILAGSTILNRQQTQSSVFAEGFVSDDLMRNISAATTLTQGTSQNVEYKYAALFGRVGYNYRDKYLLQINARRDGSSRFGPGKQFANFGSVGGGWIISNEKFASSFKSMLSYSKIRASYGVSGNDQIGDYKYLDLYNPQYYPYQSTTALGPSSLFNSNFAWERNTKLEFGIDLGFLNDKILLSTSYYRNRSGNQLIGFNLPLITGFGSVIANLPALVQNTGYEIQLNTINIKSRNFNWQSSFNISFQRNKLLAFPELEKSGYQYVIGRSLSVQKLYKFSKVDPFTGIYQFIDSSGKNTFNPKYATDRTVLIDGDPRYYGGFENSFRYLNFQFDILLQFVKIKAFNNTLGDYWPGQMGSTNNQSSKVTQRWQSPDDQALYQKYSTSNPDIVNGFSYAKGSDFALEDGSYIRVKNIQLAYTFSGNLLRRFKLAAIDIYAQCQNIYTFSKFSGIDPESASSLSLPPLRTFCFGINIKL